MIRRFPIGIQTFDKIIEGNYLYIDKTGYIDEIANKYQYVLAWSVNRILSDD